MEQKMTKERNQECAETYYNRGLALSNIEDSLIDLGFKIADGSITDIEGIAAHIESWVL